MFERTCPKTRQLARDVLRRFQSPAKSTPALVERVMTAELTSIPPDAHSLRWLAQARSALD
jgi:hypothetical protein